MIWPHSRQELYSFLEALNNVHESLKFTSNISQNTTNFLDVTITKDKKGNIQTSLYTKPTDAHLYLHYSSYHPKHQKASIPYSQAIRLNRICSTPEIYLQTTTNLSKNLRNRGYPRIMVQQAIDKALKQDRSQLLGITNTPKKTENVIPFIITYRRKLTCADFDNALRVQNVEVGRN